MTFDKKKDHIIWLVDGNGLFYRNYFKLNQLDNGGAFGFIKFLFSKDINIPEPDTTIVAWDKGLSQRRLKIYPEYKKARRESKTDEERLLVMSQISVCEEVLDNMGIVSLKIDGYEADDIIAVVVRLFAGRRVGGKRVKIILFSSDSDFYQLLETTGFYMWSLGDRKFLTESDIGTDIKNYALIKAIAGDSSDGIKGLKGIGMKRAQKIVENGAIENMDYEDRKIIERNVKLIDFDNISDEDRKIIKNEMITKYEKAGNMRKNGAINFAEVCNKYRFNSLMREMCNDRFYKGM